MPFDRLGGLVREEIGRDPRCSAMFIFFARRRTALKILFYDGNGFCIYYKRLDRGAFRIPGVDSNAEHITRSPHDMCALLDGLDVAKRCAVPRLH